MLKPVRIEAPADTPVSVSDCRRHLRLGHDEDEELLQGYLAAAIDRLDGFAGLLGRCMVSQVWRQDYECWPGGRHLRLPCMGITAVASVKYSDQDDVEQTVSSALYSLHTDDTSSFLWLKTNFTGPSLNTDRPDPVRVLFTAGYGPAADVPPPLKQAILLMVGDFYENREDTIIGVGLDARPLPTGVKALIYPYQNNYR